MLLETRFGDSHCNSSPQQAEAGGSNIRDQDALTQEDLVWKKKQNKKQQRSWGWWLTPILLALGRRNQRFKVILMVSWNAGGYMNPCLKKYRKDMCGGPHLQSQHSEDREAGGSL